MKLVILIGLVASCAAYAVFLSGLIESGSWHWLALMFVWPFVLGYFVGDENDRADYHRISDWLAEKLGLR